MSRAKKSKKPPSGRCVVCGCTDVNACDGGCSWADDAHTFCSSCAHVGDRVSARFKSNAQEFPVYALWCEDAGPESRGRWVLDVNTPDADESHPAVFYDLKDAQAAAAEEYKPGGLASMGWRVYLVRLQAVKVEEFSPAMAKKGKKR